MTATALTGDLEIRRGFARDASGLELTPDQVARPESVAEVAAVLTEAHGSATAVTPAGGQTSTTGASITDRGILLSLRRLDRIRDLDAKEGVVRVEAGAIVADVKRACAEQGWLLPLDPTSEGDCTVGGAVACNATGARSLKYGDTRRYVRAVEILLADGTAREYRRPKLEKNSAGYLLAQDPVDWFVGSEGTLGVVTAVEFALMPLPGRVVGMSVPFAEERQALAFVAAARESRLAPRCLEYFDRRALEIVRAHEGGNGWTGGAVVYAESPGDGEGGFEEEEWLALAEAHAARVDDIALFDGDAALREARRLRHSIPATMNERSARARLTGGRKVSTDWAVPYRQLGELLDATRRIADGLQVEHPVVFGHAGNGHPHQNWIATDPAQLERTERVVQGVLEEVVRRGGTVAAEHGIGKIKRRWIALQMDRYQLEAMRAVKQALDPKGILAPGNIFP